MRVNIGYFGSPEISARLLEALLADPDIRLSFVVSNPDRPKGRSGAPMETPVSAVAREQEIPLYRYESLKEGRCVEELQAYGCDLFFIFAYGRLLPPSIFNLPKRGSVNLHASLLPLLRGASPIQSAILNGLTRTGWTLQLITEELDAGDVLSSVEMEILPDETTAELTERMLPAGIALSLQTLHDFDSYYRKRDSQEHLAATFCKKLTTEISWIDWNGEAQRIHNMIRGMNPWPVARARLNGKMIRILRSAIPVTPHDDLQKRLDSAPPGRVVVVSDQRIRRLFVKTSTLPLELLEVQPENKKAMSANDFINGLRSTEDLLFDY